jgi:hypothetical protein
MSDKILEVTTIGCQREISADSYLNFMSELQRIAKQFVPYIGASGDVNIGYHTLIASGLQLTNHPVSGYYLSCDASGNAFWVKGTTSEFVPYTGATSSVDLGVYGLAGYYGVFEYLTVNSSAEVTNLNANYLQGYTYQDIINSIPTITGFVPYTGAIRGVDLNTQSITASTIKLTTGASSGYLLISDSSGNGNWGNIVNGLGINSNYLSPYSLLINTPIVSSETVISQITCTNDKVGLVITSDLQNQNSNLTEWRAYLSYFNPTQEVVVAKIAPDGTFINAGVNDISSASIVTNRLTLFDNFNLIYTYTELWQEEGNTCFQKIFTTSGGETLLEYSWNFNNNGTTDFPNTINIYNSYTNNKNSLSTSNSQLSNISYILPNTLGAIGTTLTIDLIDRGGVHLKWDDVSYIFETPLNENNSVVSIDLSAYATTNALSAYEVLTNKLTGTTLTSSITAYPSSYTVKTYVDNILGNANALIYKGTIDCSENPDYPSADAGHLYIVSISGKIGGNNGIEVEIGDMCICNTDNAPSGNQETVGEYWNIIQKNIIGAVTGPASAYTDNIALFDGTTGKVIKDAGVGLSTYATTASLTAYALSSTVASNYVPYTNAVSGLNLASQSLTANIGNFNTITVTSTELVNRLNAEYLNGNSAIDFALASHTHNGVYEPVFSKGNLTTSPTGVINISNGNQRLYGEDTAIITITQATSATDGYLSSADWNIFNGKQNALGFTPLAIDGSNANANINIGVYNFTTSGTITASNLSGINTGDETQTSIKTKLSAASANSDGYLTSTDWNTFNTKVSTVQLSTYIPYTGAVSALDLNEQNFITTGTATISYLKIPTSPTSGYVLTSSDNFGNAVWAPVKPQVATISFAGVLSQYTGVLRWTPPGTITLSGALARVTTPSSGASINFTIKVNETALASSSITSETSGGAEFSLGSTVIGKTDYITVDIDQVGSIIPGSNLVVSIFYTA